LTAKSPIPSVHSTLFSAHKHAVNGSGVANDAPWIIYIRVGFPRCGNNRRQYQSGNHRFFHVLSSLANVQIWSADVLVGELFDLTKKPVRLQEAWMFRLREPLSASARSQSEARSGCVDARNDRLIKSGHWVKCW
jgi:hypothetical protein